MRNLMSDDEKEFMEKTMNRIFDLIKNSGKKEYPLEMEIGLSRSAIQNWRLNKSKAGAYSLAKIADYFNVSVDYLLGRETSTSTNQDQQDTANNVTVDPLFNRFAKLDKSKQDKVLAYIDGLEDAENTTTKQLFNQGRMEERERELEEENMQQQKKYI